MSRPADLPHGLSARAPQLTDAEAIFELLAAYNTRLTGSPDATPAGVAEGLAAPGFERETDGWLIVDAAGRAVNFGAVVVGRHADLMICRPDSPAADWLLDTAIARAGRGTKLEIAVLRQNEPLRELITSRGFVRGTSYFQMRIDHTSRIAAPAPPAGVALITSPYDEETRRAARCSTSTATTRPRPSASTSPSASAPPASPTTGASSSREPPSDEDDVVSLPAGYTVRPPTVADAETIYRLIAAHNTTVVGSPNTTVDTVTQGLTDPAFRLETDGWLVFDADGRAITYGRVLHRTGSGVVGLSVYVPDSPASGWLFRTAVERARRIGAEHGLAEVTLESIANRDDQAARALLQGNDYELYTTYYRMRIDHADEPEPDLNLRRGPVDEADRRAAYEVMVQAFADQQGSAMRPYDEWVAAHDRHSLFDWPQLLIVELDGHVVAACDTNDTFVETDNCGFISRLGVLPEYRGQGLAKRLLRSAFALDVQAGRTGTILFVDTNNPTPALGLYESVGMRPVEVVDVLQRKLLTT